MPYIDPQDRVWLRPTAIAAAQQIDGPGELNYVLTTLINEYMRLRANKRNYTVINEVIGVLECAKLELYRKVAAPYEDEKCRLNGEVYE